MYSLIIPCAGTGTRTGLNYNKMLYSLKNDETIIERTVNKFINNSNFDQIILVINKDDEDIIKELFIDSKIEFIYGGKERGESVLNGLSLVKNEIVFIHDGARCNIQSDLIEKIIQIVDSTNYLSYSVAVKTIDSIRIGKDGFLIEALPRELLFNMQTPQIFNTQTLKDSYSNNSLDTDEIALVLKNGIKPFIIEGDYNNIKVTTRKDIDQL